MTLINFQHQWKEKGRKGKKENMDNESERKKRKEEENIKIRRRIEK